MTTLDVTVGSDNSVTHYKSSVVAAADCSGASFTGSGATIATKIATDISSLADGPVTLCVAGSTDNSSFDTASPTAASWTKDTVAPIAVYTPGHSGGVVSGDAVAVGAGSKVVLDIGFDEAMGSTAPVVQFKHGSANTNLGSAITSANTQSASVLYSVALSSNDGGSVSDAIDFGVPAAGSGVVRESVSGGGYVYKVEQAVNELYIRATANFNNGVALRARSHSSKPTSAQINSVGTLLWEHGKW